MITGDRLTYELRSVQYWLKSNSTNTATNAIYIIYYHFYAEQCKEPYININLPWSM